MVIITDLRNFISEERLFEKERERMRRIRREEREKRERGESGRERREKERENEEKEFNLRLENLNSQKIPFHQNTNPRCILHSLHPHPFLIHRFLFFLFVIKSHYCLKWKALFLKFH